MPRKQKYKGVPRLPSSGRYRGETSVLFARGPGGEYLISDKAFRTWNLVRACGTDGNGCDLNDEELGLALGIRRKQVIKVRQELEEVGLLHEGKVRGRRILHALAPGEQAPDSPTADSQTGINTPLVQEIYQMLRKYNVLPDNAQRIAVRMVEAGLNFEQARRVFLKQVAETRNIRLVVWRFERGLFVPMDEMVDQILIDAQELGIDVSQPQSQHESLPEEDQRLVDLMVDLCNSPEGAAIEAVCGAKYAWGEGWSPAAFELEVLRWLAYCLHPKFGRTVTPATYIPSQLKKGIVAATWFTDYGDLHSEIARLQMALDPPSEAPAPSDAQPVSEDETCEPEPPGPEPIPIPGTLLTCNQVWQATLGQLQMQMTRATFDTWIRHTTALAFEDDVFTIGVHNDYAKDWLENRLASLVVRTLSGIVERQVQVRFVVWNRNGHKEDS